MTYFEAVAKRDEKLSAARRMFENLRPTFAATLAEHTIDEMMRSMEDAIVVLNDGKGRYDVGAIDRFGRAFTQAELEGLVNP